MAEVAQPWAPTRTRPRALTHAMLLLCHEGAESIQCQNSVLLQPLVCAPRFTLRRPLPRAPPWRTWPPRRGRAPRSSRWPPRACRPWHLARRSGGKHGLSRTPLLSVHTKSVGHMFSSWCLHMHDGEKRATLCGAGLCGAGHCVGHYVVRPAPPASPPNLKHATTQPPRPHIPQLSRTSICAALVGQAQDGVSLEARGRGGAPVCPNSSPLQRQQQLATEAPCGDRAPPLSLRGAARSEQGMRGAGEHTR